MTTPNLEQDQLRCDKITWHPTPETHQDQIQAGLVIPFSKQGGKLKGRAAVTNVGVFEYKLPNGTTRRELRTPEEVFHPDSVASLKNLPITIEHPGLVTDSNRSQHAVGSSGSEVKQDAYRLYAPMEIERQDGLDAVKNGKRAISCGYTADVEEKAGKWMGVKYDAVQKNIRYNHIAIVDEGRAGDDAKMVGRFDSCIIFMDDNFTQGVQVDNLHEDFNPNHSAHNGQFISGPGSHKGAKNAFHRSQAKAHGEVLAKLKAVHASGKLTPAQKTKVESRMAYHTTQKSDHTNRDKAARLVGNITTKAKAAEGPKAKESSVSPANIAKAREAMRKNPPVLGTERGASLPKGPQDFATGGRTVTAGAPTNSRAVNRKSHEPANPVKPTLTANVKDMSTKDIEAQHKSLRDFRLNNQGKNQYKARENELKEAINLRNTTVAAPRPAEAPKPTPKPAEAPKVTAPKPAEAPKVTAPKVEVPSKAVASVSTARELVKAQVASGLQRILPKGGGNLAVVSGSKVTTEYGTRTTSTSKFTTKKGKAGEVTVMSRHFKGGTPDTPKEMVHHEVNVSVNGHGRQKVTWSRDLAGETAAKRTEFLSPEAPIKHLAGYF